MLGREIDEIPEDYFVSMGKKIIKFYKNFNEDYI